MKTVKLTDFKFVVKNQINSNTFMFYFAKQHGYYEQLMKKYTTANNYVTWSSLLSLWQQLNS